MESYLESVRKQFLYYKKLADQAIAQLDEAALYWQYNEASNSIAVIVTHMAGNMLSRFTDFLTSDGEKPWRNRDAEFEPAHTGKEALLQYWEEGWACLMAALDGLRAEHLEQIVYIRNEGHTVTEALNRQLAHYPYHVGQIVYIARMQRNEAWQSLSIPRNQSAAYNAEKFAQDKGRRHFTDKV